MEEELKPDYPDCMWKDSNGNFVSCTRCIYIKQTDQCCVCAHPEQPKESLRNYVYSDYGCSLFQIQTDEWLFERKVESEKALLKQLKEKYPDE